MARQSLYSRLARHERAEDTQLVLKRIFQALDESFDRIESASEILLRITSIDDCPDAFLFVLADKFKYRWNSTRSYLWNRDRLSESIVRYSMKGSPAAQRVIIQDFGGGHPLVVKDMASTLLVLGRQGRLGRSDCVIVGPDFYHDGSFLYDIDSDIDTPEFYEEFEQQRPAGRLWWYRIILPIFGECDSEWIFDAHAAEPIHNLLEGRLGRTLINLLPLPFYPNGWFDSQEFPVGWQYITNSNDGTLGGSLIGYLHLPPWGGGWIESSEYPVGWQFITNNRDGTLGSTRLGNEITLGQPPRYIIGMDIQEISPFVGSASGYLWADALVNADSNLPVDSLIAVEQAGTQIGFDTQELPEV